MHTAQIIIIAVLSITLITCEQEWTYDLISLNSNSTNSNLAEFKLKVIQIGRGKYAFSGVFEIHQDFGEDTLLDLEVYRSTTDKDEDYRLVPFGVTDESLTSFMNSYYKDYLMDALVECGTNTPQFQQFTPPLTTRRVELEKCAVPTDGFPDQLAYGKYKILADIRSSDVEVYIEIILFIEKL